MSSRGYGMNWEPATIAEVKQILHRDLGACDAEQMVVFHRYAVEPYIAPIVRYGHPESVVAVARRKNEVIYWEDVEEGFNVSSIDENGMILEHWCNQDQLGPALDAWIESRSFSGKHYPARPIS